MGDRTYCRIEVSPADETTFPWKQHSFETEGDDLTEEGLIAFCDSDANYGGVHTIEALRIAGVPFVGHHEDGGDYGGALFAFDGNSYVEVMTSKDAPGPVVEIPESGEPDPTQLQNARAYYRVWKNAVAEMKKRGASEDNWTRDVLQEAARLVGEQSK